MQHKHIINSLPLLASILGRKYGVQVQIGGDMACTNGSTIFLPSLPLDCDENLLNLTRIYLAHEAAHIRATDFTTLKAANLTTLERYIWNIFEDWRVEKKLAEIYPGCGQNFQWLIRHFFLPGATGSTGNSATASAGPPDPAAQILTWLLITVRSWAVAELVSERERLRQAVDANFPGLPKTLEPLLDSAPALCVDTASTIHLAQAVVEALKRYVVSASNALADSLGNSSGNPSESQVQQSQPQNNSSEASSPDSHTQNARQSLQDLISDNCQSLPSDLGQQLQEVLETNARQANINNRLQVAVTNRKATWPLPQSEIASTRQATTALRTRLQGLLQSTRLVRKHSARTGRLNTRKLYSAAVHNPKLFLRQGENVALNTAVHILLDASGSMNGQHMTLAAQACFAVASAMHGIKGLSLGITVFPAEPFSSPARKLSGTDSDAHPAGEPVRELGGRRFVRQTVFPLLKHNEKLHNRFGLSAAGGTPLDAALWWVLQQLQALPEPRKIILLITDGEPDYPDATAIALKAAQNLGFEVYGIGIVNQSITALLPGKQSRVIKHINELSPAMFEVLEKSLFAPTCTQASGTTSAARNRP